MTFSMKTFDKFDGLYSVIDYMEILVPNFNKAGSLTDLVVTFDHSVSNFFPSSATISFGAKHNTTIGDGSIRISISEDFGLAQSQIAVKGTKKFDSISPSFKLVDSRTIVIEKLSALVFGDKVSFVISSIQQPRYQGRVQDPFNVTVIQTSTGNEIDKA